MLCHNYCNMAFNLEDIQKNYPFLSCLKVAKEEYVGIIQNCDARLTSIYCYAFVPNDLKTLFLEYGKNWWWESNRKTPVNMFIGNDFAVFRSSLRSFSTKECEVLFGPVTKLSDLVVNKRVRRKTVQLLRRMQ